MVEQLSPLALPQGARTHQVPRPAPPRPCISRRRPPEGTHRGREEGQNCGVRRPAKVWGVERTPTSAFLMLVFTRVHFTHDCCACRKVLGLPGRNSGGLSTTQRQFAHTLATATAKSFDEMSAPLLASFPVVAVKLTVGRRLLLAPIGSRISLAKCCERAYTFELDEGTSPKRVWWVLRKEVVGRQSALLPTVSEAMLYVRSSLVERITTVEWHQLEEDASYMATGTPGHAATTCCTQFCQPPRQPSCTRH